MTSISEHDLAAIRQLYNASNTFRTRPQSATAVVNASGNNKPRFYRLFNQPDHPSGLPLLLDDRDLAQVFDISCKDLRAMLESGEGPPYFTFQTRNKERSIRFLAHDVIEWLNNIHNKSQTPEIILDRSDLAKILKLNDTQLLHLLKSGAGPSYILLGTAKRWRRTDVERWLDSISSRAL